MGPSKDDRPDLPQIKGMQAGLDPLGRPVATEVVAGARAVDPLSVPCIGRVQASRGRHGLLYGGDCTRASRETRAFIGAPGDVSLCPLPQVQRAEGECEAALASVWSGAHTRIPVFRERPEGTSALRAEGETTIHGADAAGVSYPTFFEELEKVAGR